MQETEHEEEDGGRLYVLKNVHIIPLWQSEKGNVQVLLVFIYKAPSILMVWYVSVCERCRSFALEEMQEWEYYI